MAYNPHFSIYAATTLAQDMTITVQKISQSRMVLPYSTLVLRSEWSNFSKIQGVSPKRVHTPASHSASSHSLPPSS